MNKLPEPYYQDDSCTIYCGDCREILPLLPKLDLVLTDPPYGIGIDYGPTYQDSRERLVKLIPEWLPKALEHAERVVMTPGVTNLWLYPEPTWTMCWAISGAGSRGFWGFSCWQPILCYGADPYLASGMGALPDLIYLNESAPCNGHPCPKPSGLMRRLVTRCSTSLGQTILDPFMGSGTTLRAAKDLGRKAIGIEINPEYCEIAKRRLAQEVFAL